MSLEVFISHSHRDERLAKALATLVRNGAGLEVREIRCTSFAPTGLGLGRKITKALRRDLERCNYFIPLITRNAKDSEFVQFEIGAAWVLETEIMPAIFKMGPKQRMPAVLSGIVYTDLENERDVANLASTLTSKIWRKKDRVTFSEIQDAAAAFMHSTRNLRG